MTKLESEFEREVVKWAETQGGLALKLKLENERGWPDRTIILPGGFIAFAELKRSGERSKKYHMQKVWIDRLHKFNLPAAFCETITDIEDLCK